MLFGLERVMKRDFTARLWVSKIHDMLNSNQQQQDTTLPLHATLKNLYFHGGSSAPRFFE